MERRAASGGLSCKEYHMETKKFELIDLPAKVAVRRADNRNE
jgi:hypothetical protein